MMEEQIKILCVDDETNVLRSLQRLFMDEDYEILTATNGADGLAILQDNPDIQLIISDYRMPGMDGIEFLKQVHERQPQTIRIVLSGYADTAAVVGAINEGQIYKFIPKPWNDEELLITIRGAIDVFSLRQKNIQLTEKLQDTNDELMHLNNNLEDEVKKRTAELIFQNNAMRFAHNVMNSLPMAVLGLDNDGLIVLGNKLSESLFTDVSRSLVGMTSAGLFPPELNALLAQLQKDKLAEGQLSISDKLYNVKGTRILAEHDQEGLILLFIPA